MGKTPKGLSRGWELTAKSSHFSLEERWFTSIFERDFHLLEEVFNLQRSGRERMNREFTENDRNESRTGHRKNEESRFRGTRTLPYAYRGSECQSERAPAWRENAFWSRVLDSSRHSDAKWEKEVIRGRPNADQRTLWYGWREIWTHRWTDKIPKNRRKCWELSAPSGQLARQEWLFCLTRPLFKEIAILWRNSTILSDESTATKFSLRTREERNREISKAVDEKSKKIDKNRTVV